MKTILEILADEKLEEAIAKELEIKDPDLEGAEAAIKKNHKGEIMLKEKEE